MSVYTPAQVEAIEDDNVLPARLWEIRFASETWRVWNGNVDRVFGGHRWQGMRGLVEAPTTPFPRDGSNETVEFLIRGMPDRIEDMMWDHEEEVHGRLLVDHVQMLAERGTRDHRALQPIGPMIGTMIYVMRGIQSDEAAATEDGQTERTYDLSIMAELLTAARSEASFGRYSPADQLARYPGIVDGIFSDVPTIARGQTLKLF
ncbi:hypothetical protein ATO13_08491 [Stappia sp. 22II-S9-Z10]|nr:hypothetical protein ATO13_08491 [Stappia sp. 22II-S9-Z10]